MKGLKMLNFSNTCPMVSSWFFGPDCWLVHGFQLHQRIQKNIWRCNMYLAVWLQSVFHCHLPFSSLDEWWSKCRANNLANINAIVAKYRGANVTQLWAQLAIKVSWCNNFLDYLIHLRSSWFILIHIDSSQGTMFHLSMVWNCYPELCIKALLSNTVRKSCGQNWKIPSQRHRKWMVMGNIPWLPWGFLKIIVVYTVIPEADQNYFNPSSLGCWLATFATRWDERFWPRVSRPVERSCWVGL